MLDIQVVSVINCTAGAPGGGFDFVAINGDGFRLYGSSSTLCRLKVGKDGYPEFGDPLIPLPSDIRLPWRRERLVVQTIREDDGTVYVVKFCWFCGWREIVLAKRRAEAAAKQAELAAARAREIAEQVREKIPAQEAARMLAKRWGTPEPLRRPRLKVVA